ncbi:glycosyltransferase family 2 protein [Flavobacterium sp. H122]|uniref:glycosyltransferase family 2 protein n=1 Tax=Flavobacterium sp. H122 TaxID=2529860 RepID=UPI0010AB1678|nr:glycosyltransferase family 2 protein [Flavobacterium sp. H122]
MRISLIICTYQRPDSLFQLLQSIVLQSVYPDEILIVDGSVDDKTSVMISEKHWDNLQYHKVPVEHRGLTKQRNYGIERVSSQTDVVCFLDDDTILSKNYFEEIIKTYDQFPNALGVGGYITNEVNWEFKGTDFVPAVNQFKFEGWVRKDGSRFVFRKKLGLDADKQPGYLPEFSHGRSISFLPPSGKIYQVEQLMGGVSSFRKEVFEKLKFSTYFEGYGLYEDADFTLRLSKHGDLYVNTAAQLEHHHHPSGRPNQYHYGKMVVCNGWYVWRVKYSCPSLKAKLKWHAITILLTLIRATNVVTGKQKKAAFTETLGRIVGWFSIFVKKPQ